MHLTSANSKGGGGITMKKPASVVCIQVAGVMVENTFTSVEDMVSRVVPPLGFVIGTGKSWEQLAQCLCATLARAHTYTRTHTRMTHLCVSCDRRGHQKAAPAGEGDIWVCWQRACSSPSTCPISKARPRPQACPFLLACPCLKAWLLLEPALSFKPSSGLWLH